MSFLASSYLLIRNELSYFNSFASPTSRGFHVKRSLECNTSLLNWQYNEKINFKYDGVDEFKADLKEAPSLESKIWETIGR